MSAVSFLKQGRKEAERLMVDTVTITRVTTSDTVDEDTLQYEETVDVIYSGKAKVQTYEPFEQNPEAGGHSFTVQRYRIHVPAETEDIRVDDTVTVTASELDVSLVGKSYRVAALLHKSFATAQRLFVDEIVN